MRMLSGLISLYQESYKLSQEEVKYSHITLPVNETKLMDGLDGQDTLCYIKPRYIFRECVVLDEHGHEVSTGKKFHD